MKFGLPIDDIISDVEAAVEQNISIVLRAEPGSGKTTCIPQVIEKKTTKKILVLEPRRLAARLAAEYVAKMRGEKIGESVGYRIRYQHQSGPLTKIEYITEGIFIRLIQSDPLLNEYECLILDEFHERNIFSDIALALGRQLQKTKRPDFKIVIMSATLDAKIFQHYFDSEKFIDAKGSVFPVRINYKVPLTGKVEEQVYWALKQILGDNTSRGNILVFLNGIVDIRKTQNHLLLHEDLRPYKVFPLSGELSVQEQQQVFSDSALPKIVLATNIAETSLTIPGVKAVIDLGTAKIPGFALWNGLSTLETKKICQASANQRAGRAGREAPGMVLRLYSEGDFLSRPAFLVPDINRLDFSSYGLSLLKIKFLQNLSTHELFSQLPWLETPNEKLLVSANKLLTMIGAIDSQGKITTLGEKMATLPLHPRLAAMAFAASGMPGQKLILLAVALLNEGAINNRRNIEESYKIVSDSDVIEFLEANKRFLLSELKKNDPSYSLGWVNLFRELTRYFKLSGSFQEQEFIYEGFDEALLLAFADRVAKKLEHQGKGSRVRYQFCQGGQGELTPQSSLFSHPPEYIIVIDALQKLGSDTTTHIPIVLAHSIDLANLLKDPGKHLRTENEQRINEMRGTKEDFNAIFYDQILIKQEIIRSKDTDDSGHLILDYLRQNWPKPFAHDEELHQYNLKALILQKYFPEAGFFEIKGDFFELLISHICADKKSINEIKSQPLQEYINELLTWEQLELLRKEMPNSYQLANGKLIHLHYDPEGFVYAQDFIQHFFGLKSHPTLLGGRLKIQLSLLGPNKRPAQKTSDLMGFWQNLYPKLVSEWGRQYPRHHWSLDPTNALPILTKSRLPK